MNWWGELMNWCPGSWRILGSLKSRFLEPRILHIQVPGYPGSPGSQISRDPDILDTQDPGYPGSWTSCILDILGSWTSSILDIRDLGYPGSWKSRILDIKDSGDPGLHIQDPAQP